MNIPDLGDLLERLLQVRAEDYDARAGWSWLQDARRALKTADTEGERHEAAIATVEAGLALLGLPVDEDATTVAKHVAATDIHLRPTKPSSNARLPPKRPDRADGNRRTRPGPDH